MSETAEQIIDIEPEVVQGVGALPSTTQSLPARGDVTPMQMLNQALQKGTDIAIIEKLMDLAERWDKAQARKAFDNAIAAAKAEIPVIPKRRKVDFTSQKGRTSYLHEGFGDIAEIVDPILAKHGLSYRHRTAQEGNKVTVTCVLSHRDGHYEETTLFADRDETGNKNPIQAVGSTVAYLQRYTLKAALGLAAAEDDDGRSSVVDDKITKEQCDELLAIADEHGIDKAEFCRRHEIASFAAISRDNFPKARAVLQQLAQKAKQEAPNAG